MKEVTNYINKFPKDIKMRLKVVRAAIKSQVPGGVESLKWGMPAISYSRILVTYAPFKKHIGFFPTPSVMKAFAKDLKKFTTSKGGVQFPYDKPLPVPLIKKMTKFRVKESLEKDSRWH